MNVVLLPGLQCESNSSACRGRLEDRSENDCLSWFRSPPTCVTAGLYSAEPGMPPKQ